MNIDLKEVTDELFPLKEIDEITLQAFESILHKPLKDITKQLMTYMAFEFTDSEDQPDLTKSVSDIIEEFKTIISSAKELYNL